MCSNPVLGLVDLGFGGVGATLWALLAGFGAVLGSSWLLLDGPGPALGTFLGPRGHLLGGLGRILGGFWVPGTLWALILEGPGTCRAGFCYVVGRRCCYDVESCIACCVLLRGAGKFNKGTSTHHVSGSCLTMVFVAPSAFLPNAFLMQ